MDAAAPILSMSADVLTPRPRTNIQQHHDNLVMSVVPDDESGIEYRGHGGCLESGHDLRRHGFTQQDMQTDPSVFIDVAVTTTYMPPSTTRASPVERMDFGTWLSCGRALSAT